MWRFGFLVGILDIVVFQALFDLFVLGPKKIHFFTKLNDNIVQVIDDLVLVGDTGLQLCNSLFHSPKEE